MELFEKVKKFFRTGLEAIQKHFRDEQRHMLEAKEAQEMVRYYMDQYGITRDEAEQIAIAMLYMRNAAMGMAAGPAAKSAQAVGRAAFKKSIDPKLALKLSRKAMAKITELEKKFKFSVRSNPKTWPQAAIDAIKKNPLLFGLILTQMDVFVWGPKAVSYTHLTLPTKRIV